MWSVILLFFKKFSSKQTNTCEEVWFYSGFVAFLPWNSSVFFSFAFLLWKGWEENNFDGDIWDQEVVSRFCFYKNMFNVYLLLSLYVYVVWVCECMCMVCGDGCACQCACVFEHLYIYVHVCTMYMCTLKCWMLRFPTLAKWHICLLLLPAKSMPWTVSYQSKCCFFQCWCYFKKNFFLPFHCRYPDFYT